MKHGSKRPESDEQREGKAVTQLWRAGTKRCQVNGNGDSVAFFTPNLLSRFGAVLLAPILLGLAGDTFYFRNQQTADARLLEFDQLNPSCQLWTNWQKMCSRTGINGRTYCVEDPGRRVVPSEPICVSDGKAHSRPTFKTLSDRQVTSLRRFCLPESASIGPTGRKNEECGFDKVRPFNGRRLAARLHPWCGQWNESITRRPICENGSHGDLKACSSLAARGFESSRGLYCSRPLVPAWCKKAEGLGAEYENIGRDIVVPTAERLEGYMVRGIYCSERN